MQPIADMLSLKKSAVIKRHSRLKQLVQNWKQEQMALHQQETLSQEEHVNPTQEPFDQDLGQFAQDWKQIQMETLNQQPEIFYSDKELEGRMFKNDS